MKEKMKEKIKGSRENEERSRCKEVKHFVCKKCFRSQNPPDELAQNVSKKKKHSDELFLHFFFETSESDRFFQLFT